MNYKIYYIDYQDGFAKTQLTNLDINFIEYKESNFSLTFNESINFIVPFTMLTETGKYTFLNESKNKLKVLYYIIHPKSFWWLIGRGKLDYKSTVGIINKIKNAFSMGTSAIECASFKIPTIVPLVFEKLTYMPNRFTKFFELSDYNLGCYDCDKSIMKLTDFNEILDDIYLHNCKEKYSVSSFNYYNNNHTSKKSINSLLNFFL